MSETGSRGDTRGVRQAHEAFVGSLYGDGGMEEVREEKDMGFKWRPSAEDLTRVCGVETSGGAQEEKKSGSNGQTSVQMRGGGPMSKLFSLKRRASTAKTGPARPEIISRPSDAFDNTGRVVVPGWRYEELETRPGPSGVQDSRLLRVRQMEKLVPGSRVSSEGRLSSLAGSRKTTSIVPEGTIASFDMGERSRPASEDASGAQVLLGGSMAPLPSGFVRHDDGLPQKVPPAWSEGSESTVHGESPMRDLHVQHNMPPRKPSIGGPSQEINTELPEVEKEEEGEPSVRRLGSPMQSPIQAITDSSSEPARLTGIPRYQKISSLSSSGSVEDPQTTFFAPQSAISPSVAGSLRRKRRPLLSQAVGPPLPPVHERDSRPPLFAPGSSFLQIATLLQQNTVASEMADTSGGSVWQGGNEGSVAPEDSHSEVMERKHWQQLPRTDSQVHRHSETEELDGEGIQEVGEGYETKREVKERAEERFRDEIRKVWSHYQTRMRMINEDVERTTEEKERVRRVKPYKVICVC